MSSDQCMSPFLKQCFVTCGVSLNLASSGLVMGYAAGLLEQLASPDSAIRIDDSSGSWIAAMPGFSLFFGNILVIPIMEKFGRRTANLISIIPLIIGWMLIIFSSTVHIMLVGRFLHGIYMGMCLSLGSLLIGEYTSPNNRGVFLMTISVSISAAVFSIHTLGSYLHWRTAAMICTCIAFIDLLMILCSPESPSWLASHGRYEDSKKVYRWLRGNDEETELQKMIAASMIVRESNAETKTSETAAKKLYRSLLYCSTSIRKKEFYKPVIIMVHIYVLSQWSGVYLVVAYTAELYNRVVGKEADVALMIMALDVQRIVSNIIALYVIRKVKRRTMLLVTVGINIAALIAIAIYSYAKDSNALPYDHHMIGIVLTRCLMLAIATGSLSLGYIIAGEIFPLEFKNLAGGLSVLLFSVNMFCSIKTVPLLFRNFGLHGTFGIYAVIVSYSLFVSWAMLPETKDRTLQDIEDEFRGRPLSPQELKFVQSLT